MRHRIAVTIALTLSTCHIAAAEAASAAWKDPRALADLARRGNAKSVVASVYSNQEAWSYVIEHVASGDPPWIAAAKALHRGSDAGTSSELRDAMFQALAANPAVVLSDAEPEFDLSSLCGGRSDPLGTFEAASSELDLTIRAVEALQSRELTSRKRACLSDLRESRANLKRFFGQ